MLLDWLQRKVELRAARAAGEDLERFIAALRDKSDDEIAMLVAAGAITRLRLREAGHLPDDVLRPASTLIEYEQAMVQRRISRLARGFRRANEYVDAAGAMIWVHTLRALRHAHLRDPGRQMWRQLERGFPLSSVALARIETLSNRQAPAGALVACLFVPEELRARIPGDAPPQEEPRAPIEH